MATPADNANDAAPPAEGDAPKKEESSSAEGGAATENAAKLFVGNLNFDTTEARIREEFSKYGTVTEVLLPTTRGNRPRGFGYVTFATKEEATEALGKLDQLELDGRNIRVRTSLPKKDLPPGLGPGGFGDFDSTGKETIKLYVGNLSFDTTQESVKALFEPHGTVTDCYMPTDRDSGSVRGFCFVTMAAADAQVACEKLNGHELDGRALRVNQAQPRGGRRR